MTNAHARIVHTSGACNQNNENSKTYDEKYLFKLFEVTKS